MSKNNLFKLLFVSLFAFAATAFTGCSDDNDDVVAPVLTAQTTALQFGAEDGAKTVAIEANCEWTVDASTLEGWAEVSPLRGSGNATLTVRPVGEITANKQGVIGFTLIHPQYGKWGQSETKITVVRYYKDAPGPIETEVIYNETFGSGVCKNDSGQWLYLDQYTDYQTTGTGAANVTYKGKGSSIRNSGLASTGYEGCSGPNHVWLGTNSPYAMIQNIALNGKADLRLTMGASYSIKDDATGEYDNEWKEGVFHIYLGSSENSWTEISYEIVKGTNDTKWWGFITADFTLTAVPENLFIKISSDVASAIKFDDVTLQTGIGGQSVSLEGGDTPTPPTPGDVIYTNNFDKEKATKTFGTNGSSWPYIDQFEGWKNESGTGASSVTYEGSGVSVRANSESNGNYSNYAGSGANNIFFGTNGMLVIGNIALPSNNLRLTFGTERYINGEDNTFKNEEFLVTLSADGKTWSTPINYSFEAGSDTNGKWNVATADFTLPGEVKTLYIKFASTITSAHRIDDVTLQTGIGGQSITFEGGEPQPATPSVTTADYSALTAASVVLGGSYADFASAPAEVGVEYVLFTSGTVDMLDWTKAEKVAAAAVASPFTVNVSNLTAETQYAYRAYADNVYGTVKTFVTEKSGDTPVVPGGDVYTFDYASIAEVNSTVGIISVACEQNDGKSAPATNETWTDLRLYQNNSINITAEGKTITKIEFTFVDATRMGSAFNTVNGGTYTVDEAVATGVWTGSQSAVNFKNNSDGNTTNIQVRIQKIVVYTGEGGDTPTPPTPPVGDETVVTMTFNDIKAGGTGMTVNSYGSQNVNTESTWYNWTIDGVKFTGCRICEANGNNAGLLQMQGNASDITKQGFLGNADDLGKITKIVITTKNTTYEPSYNVYVGSDKMPKGTAQAKNVSQLADDGAHHVYEDTYDLSSGNYGFFSLRNDTVGATYIDKIVITYQK